MEIRDRLEQAEALMKCCTLCEHRCQVNRIKGERGRCKVANSTYYLNEALQNWDELAGEPSYVILMNGCVLRCAYCIFGATMEDPEQGTLINVDTFAVKARRVKSSGIKNVYFLGGEPTAHVATLLRLAEGVPQGMKIVLNTNMYFSEETADLLDGVIDSYVAEIRYGNDRCASKYSQVENYWEVVCRNTLRARQMGNLVIRHLLLPGHLNCCFVQLTDWIRQNAEDVTLSIRNEYIPVHRAAEFPEINRRVKGEEFQRSVEISKRKGLKVIHQYFTG